MTTILVAPFNHNHCTPFAPLIALRDDREAKPYIMKYPKATTKIMTPYTNLLYISSQRLRTRHRAKTFLQGLAIVSGALGLAFAMPGCHQRNNTTTTSVKRAQVKPLINPDGTSSNVPPLAKEELALHPNEAGVVPVLMYHAIDTKGHGKYKPDQVDSNVRSPEGFRKELQMMYDANYRPVTLKEFLDNKIDLPIGKSPVILTFDDSRKTQFNYLPDGSVDPDCAIGILQEFNRQHPDWAVKATFFVQPVPVTRAFFGQPEFSERKLQELVKMGCEVENHTLTHPRLRVLSDERVQKEIAGCEAEIHKALPDYKVDSLALPYGIWPRNRKLASDGEANGIKYHNRAVLVVGFHPSKASIAKEFKPGHIPRIQAAGSGLNTSADWLVRIKEDGSRYVSDGDPAITTIPKYLLPKIDLKRLNGSALRTY